jgi:hypothetical protein
MPSGVGLADTPCVTPTDDARVRARRTGRWIVGPCLVLVLLVAWLLVLDLGSYMSPWVAFACAVAVMLAVDAFALAVVARGSGHRSAAKCAGVALAALAIQASGVYLSGFLFLDWLTFPGSGWLFWTLPVVALALSIFLLGRRSSRPYGWAVLVGSAEGFALPAGTRGKCSRSRGAPGPRTSTFPMLATTTNEPTRTIQMPANVSDPIRGSDHQVFEHDGRRLEHHVFRLATSVPKRGRTGRLQRTPGGLRGDG